MPFLGGSTIAMYPLKKASSPRIDPEVQAIVSRVRARENSLHHSLGIYKAVAARDSGSSVTELFRPKTALEMISVGLKS